MEKPGKGDGARRLGPFLGDEPHPEKSALFLYLNTSKKSITLNLKSATGVKIMKELVKDTDVLVENYEPSVMPGLGLAYENLVEVNPMLVMTSISGFGHTGPYRDYKVTSIIGNAMGGLMYVSGQPDREPLQNSSYQPEYNGGLYGFIGTMTALLSRRDTNKGQHVDVSIMECMAGSHQFTLTWPAYSGTLLERPGWRMPIYRCKDGYVVLTLIRVEIALLSQLIDRPELLEDPRFQTEADRAENISVLEAIVAEGFAGLGKKQIFDAFGSWRGVSGFVATIEDVLNDPHYHAREFWVGIDHPYAGELLYPSAPAKATESCWKGNRAPLLGEHNQEIYCNRLGYTREDLVRLRQADVI